VRDLLTIFLSFLISFYQAQWCSERKYQHRQENIDGDSSCFKVLRVGYPINEPDERIFQNEDIDRLFEEEFEFKARPAFRDNIVRCSHYTVTFLFCKLLLYLLSSEYSDHKNLPINYFPFENGCEMLALISPETKNKDPSSKPLLVMKSKRSEPFLQ
jgi:hypothetical protein